MTQAIVKRPPRPKLMDPDEWAEVALKAGAKKREVIGFEHLPDGEILVITKPNTKSVIGVNGKLRPYVPPTVGIEDFEPWTLKHLDQAAEQEPANAMGMYPHQWINQYPERAVLRAWSWWKHVAKGKDITMAQAAAEHDHCREARRIILASGWLGAEDAAQL